MDWFRSWHGAPTDPKWLFIAKRSETQPGIVSAIVWALFDFASQNESDRGGIDGFDIETYAAFSGFDEDVVARVIDCLKQKSIIVDGRLAAWEARQPKREDTSTDRVRKHRNSVKRNETQCNAPEKDTDTDLDSSEANASGADAPPIDPAVPEREYFARGREILGNGSGALIAKLLKAKGRNVALARAALETASQKQDPKEYVAAICRGGKNGNATSNNRSDTATGRATAREAEHVASVGNAALQYLRQGKSTGPDREASGGFGFADVSHAHGRAKAAH